MPDPLLRTKLFVPPLRPHLIPRPNLVNRLNQSLHLGHKLILVSAPAGFGKTTLVTDWLAQVNLPLAWLSLDDDDNELLRFFSYISAAVRQIEGVGSSLQDLLQSAQTPSFKSLATALINDCTQATTPFILTIDDYHAVSDQLINEVVLFLVENAPPNLHMVITSRSDPQFPLSRLRARGVMTELRTDDLRFTTAEAASFLGKMTGVDLEPDEVSALETRTEGWVAGLQMAALSIQGLHAADEIATFVNDFTSSHRYIFDYLTDEVLNKRPADSQAFLLQSSILDRFNASLAAVVTGHEDSQAIMEALEGANLFLFSLDKNRQWYRYHHLFADLLRQRLQRRFPELVPELYLRASQWFADHDDIETAVNYALEGKAVFIAVHLLEAVALDYIRRSEVIKLMRLVRRLPEDAQRRSPRLCLARAWGHVFASEFDLAETFIGHAESSLVQQEAFSDEFPEALAWATTATIRAFIATRRQQLSRALVLSDEALGWLNELPEETAQSLRGPLLVNLGQTKAALDMTEEAERSYRQAMEDCKAAGNSFALMAAYSNLMRLQRRQGKLDAAKALGLQGLSWVAHMRKQKNLRVPAEGEIRQELGINCYEQNQLAEAEIHLEKGIDLYRYNSPESFARCLHYLFLVEFAAADLDEAVNVHRQIEPVLHELPRAANRMQAANKSERARRLSRIQPGASQWTEEMRLWLVTVEAEQTISINFAHRSKAFIHACVLAALDQPEAALAILQQLADAAEAAT